MTKREQITRDYLAGMTVKQLSDKYGRTYGGIQTSLSRWGVRLPEGERERRAGRGKYWADCPEHLREDYKVLRRYMSAREARTTLEGQA